MYFDDVELFNPEFFISNLDNMYAHRDRTDKTRREKLTDHINLTYKYFEFICSEKDLDNVFNNLQKDILEDRCEDVICLWKEMLANTIYMHDIGKINPAFQYANMLNKLYKDNSAGEKNHSLLGSYIYVSYFNGRINKIKKRYDRYYLKYFMYLNSYIISRHHGFLGSIEGYGEKLKNFSENYKKETYYPDLNMDVLGERVIYKSFCNSQEYIKDCFLANSKLDFTLYIYSKLLFSILTAADYYATSQFMNGEKVDDMGIMDDELKKRFSRDVEDYDILKSIRSYEKNPVIDGKYSNINQLRSKITLESEKSYLKNRNKNIYYLEAPTGAGKTITSINLVRHMLNSNEKINKLFYVFPFNTLVEQTESAFIKIFKNDSKIRESISVINSITPIKTVDKDYEVESDLDSGRKTDYEKSLLNRIFINYPFVITTHVNLFNSLFGTSRKEVFPLINLCNSIIILDEIQSYKNEIWKEIINFLDSYSELLNIKVIIMSATLPRLNKLVEGNSNDFIYLIEDRNKYFKNPYFKSRVKFEMLDLGDEEEQFEKLSRDIQAESRDNGKILIEFIFKKRADRFFDYMNKNFENKYGHEIKIMTADDNKIDRGKIVKMARDKEKKIILIATQIVEAGIDIDMDLGYKNISILDAEEQFMGRVNRSCLKKGRVKFFKIDDCRVIYKGDVRREKELTLIQSEIQKLLGEKDFEKYYEKVIEKIKLKKQESNDHGYEAFTKKLDSMNFKAVQDYMKLIDEDQNKYTVFISREIKLGNNDVIYGDDIWKEYKDVLMDKSMGYAEKKVKLSKITPNLGYFIYKVKEIPTEYSDMLGDIYYISDGEKYIRDGRFNQEIFIGEAPDEANLFM
ncbi:CRISPR-associated helicase/endonuclease Cas3 [Clostridium autoethanogenum]|uniref:CRISPR-associated helicase/endonuclease Cas3 n=1 Tax=Clostridium autoethanogenum DSM 10061 TaxID=1341692 RepID=A0ABM5NT79_9CLOT|nr:CRISPR-associated helicase/endonuclease Cas3 [Clostridium autoethanogenum]AGY75622.1 CRISPR-associated helicase/endonuclease Cas3 [Clostridium autoethanogenum DSM 10061]ALU35785.1 CRISPR-associated helicase Cas3 [Clostridium autoethanogenum DSM 10061]OVY52153.1 CRISPR-associated nuclease/helicase Cas3 [Clostridium autoethanogenum]